MKQVVSEQTKNIPKQLSLFCCSLPSSPKMGTTSFPWKCLKIGVFSRFEKLKFLGPKKVEQRPAVFKAPEKQN